MKTVKTLTGSECHLLLEELKNPQKKRRASPRDHRNYCIALIMLDAGLRLNEAVSLRPENVSFASLVADSVIVTADIAKTKKERRVPMSARLKEALKNYLEARPFLLASSKNYYLFYKVHPTYPLTTRAIQKRIEWAAKIAYGRHTTPHMLRHTFATRLMKRVNIRIVQELLGHASLTSTQIYCHPDSDDLTNAIDQLNDSHS